MPHACRMRATSSSKCTALGIGYGSGHRSRIVTRPAALRQQDGEHDPDRAAPDDRDVDRRRRPARRRGDRSWLAQWLVAPQADPVVATVVVPVGRHDPGAVADLDLEPGRALDVEAEHAVVVVTAETVRDRQIRPPTPGRRPHRRRRGRSSRTSRGAGPAAARTARGRGPACGAARCSGRSGPRARCPARAPSPASRTAAARAPRWRTRATRRTPWWRTRQCPKPTPSVWKPAGTSADSNGAARRPVRSPARSRTPHGAVVLRSRSTPRAAHSSRCRLGRVRGRPTG